MPGLLPRFPTNIRGRPLIDGLAVENVSQSVKALVDQPSIVVFDRQQLFCADIYGRPQTFGTPARLADIVEGGGDTGIAGNVEAFFPVGVDGVLRMAAM